MVTDNSKRPNCHSSSSLPQGRQRRASGRKSFTSTTLPPMMESPRTLCPKDYDDFSYMPSHLPRWHAPTELWERLPQNLKSVLASMQQAGAAVLTDPELEQISPYLLMAVHGRLFLSPLTACVRHGHLALVNCHAASTCRDCRVNNQWSGFERAEHHHGNIDIEPTTTTPGDEMVVQLEDCIHCLPSLPPQLRTDSSVCSSAILSSPSSGTGSPMSSFSASQNTSPISPICLTPADANMPVKRERERSFSTPLEPHNAYYATELSQLRTESLPRLRHAARKVDTEWYEVKRIGAVSPGDINEFENWWADKKCTILSLDEKGKRLSTAIGLSSTGMGWTAP